MPSDGDMDLFAKALSLPVPERARLAHELIRSLEEGDDADAAACWVTELERRLAEVVPGRVAPEDWELIRERWRARWPRR